MLDLLSLRGIVDPCGVDVGGNSVAVLLELLDEALEVVVLGDVGGEGSVGEGGVNSADVFVQ